MLAILLACVLLAVLTALVQWPYSRRELDVVDAILLARVDFGLASSLKSIHNALLHCISYTPRYWVLL